LAFYIAALGKERPAFCQYRRHLVHVVFYQN